MAGDRIWVVSFGCSGPLKGGSLKGCRLKGTNGGDLRTPIFLFFFCGLEVGKLDVLCGAFFFSVNMFN